MASVTVNFDDVEDEKDFTPLPAGKYSVVVEDVTEKTTKAGNDMWSLKLKVTHGEFEGRFLFDNLVFLSGPGMQKVKMVFKRCGLPHEGTIDCWPDKLIGQKFYVGATIGEYNGKPTNDIGFNYYDTSEEEPENTDTKMPFDG